MIFYMNDLLMEKKNCILLDLEEDRITLFY